MGIAKIRITFRWKYETEWPFTRLHTNVSHQVLLYHFFGLDTCIGMLYIILKLIEQRKLLTYFFWLWRHYDITALNFRDFCRPLITFALKMAQKVTGIEVVRNRGWGAGAHVKLEDPRVYSTTILINLT